MSVSIPRISGGGRKLNEPGDECTVTAAERPTHTGSVSDIQDKKTINSGLLRAVSAFYTGRNRKVVLIPKYLILAWRAGACLSIMDAPKRPRY